MASIYPLSELTVKDRKFYHKPSGLDEADLAYVKSRKSAVRRGVWGEILLILSVLTMVSAVCVGWVWGAKGVLLGLALGIFALVLFAFWYALDDLLYNQEVTLLFVLPSNKNVTVTFNGTVREIDEFVEKINQSFGTSG